MGAGVQVAFGIVMGVAILAVGAVFAGRAEEAARAVAVLGCTALGLMLLADLLLAAGLTLPPSRSYVPIGLQVGGYSLALLALVLTLMGGLTGIAWAGRRRRLADLGVLGCALVALLAGVALTADSLAGWVHLNVGTQRNAVALAGFGVGTLAVALIAFWAVPIVRQGARSRRVTASLPPV